MSDVGQLAIHLSPAHSLHSRLANRKKKKLFSDREALEKQGDNALGSVRSSVCPDDCALLLELFHP